MRLYIADSRVLLRGEPEEYFPLISPKRAEAAGRMKVDAAKRLGVCAGLLMSGVFGSAEPELSQFGKPYFPGKDCFSLSHSGTLAVLAVGGVCVGVDIERLRSADMRLARRFFHPAEYEYLQSCGEQDMDFTRIWTHKESFLKALGTGLTVRPSTFLLPKPGEALSFDGADWYFSEVPLPGYSLTLCDRGAAPKPEIIEFKPSGA